MKPAGHPRERLVWLCPGATSRNPACLNSGPHGKPPGPDQHRCGACLCDPERARSEQRRSPGRKELVLRSWQTKMFAQSGPLVFVTKNASTPQLRDDKVHEIVEAGGHCWEHDVEPIGSARLQPRLHRVCDLTGRPDDLEAAEATHSLSELTDG